MPKPTNPSSKPRSFTKTITMEQINDLYLIVLLEAQELGALSEASPADVQTILADDTTPPLADSATPLEGAFCICPWVLGNEIDRHTLKRQTITAVTAFPEINVSCECSKCSLFTSGAF